MITKDPIRLDKELADVLDTDNGAVVVFTGVVRADAIEGRRVDRIHYDCYQEMAAGEMSLLIDQIRAESGVTSIRALHRVGDVPAGEISLLVVVTAGHRGEAYDASRKVVEEIKHRVPIWKKEIYDDGSSQWL
ncbi:MAG: molybdenum cofactor biosynthesis protein MoaE [Candidatus Krumholzibacteria bacterium]|nr:molybdenum cofactor biosynthesis protein MoaE [Candidatus Krumholzibacteria bacterium]